MQLFDAGETFGDDYLYFYESFLTEDRSRSDADRIVELLDLREGESLLDAPCGHGRIANILAARGVKVTGVDLVERFLEMARQKATERDVDVDYRRGDLRQLPTDGPFDTAICWFTSFGYFDDPDNLHVLKEFARVLRPGGRLAIEMMHHDGMVRRFTPAPFSSVLYRGDDAMIDSSVFDPTTGRIITDRVVYRGGEVRRTRHQVRLPTVPEFSSWLEEAGFADAQFLGPEGPPPTIDDSRMTVLATR